MGKHTNKKKKFPVLEQGDFIALILLIVLAIGVSVWKKRFGDPAENTESGGDGRPEGAECEQR